MNTNTTVLALGGCGSMGRAAVQTILSFPDVAEIVIADRDGPRGADFAAACGHMSADGPRVTSLALDVTDTEVLEAAIADSDVVVNTVGPFFRYGVPILQATIDVARPYIDICDDWEPTLAMLELDAAARAAKVPAIIGMGASPGISNLLAAHATAELDEVHAITTGWSLEDDGETQVAASGEDAAIEHWIHQCSGRIRVVRDGGLIDVRPLERLWVDLPGGAQTAAWTLGHPEPLTFARAWPQLRRSENVMLGDRTLIAMLQVLRPLIDAKVVSERRVARLVTRLARHDRVVAATGVRRESGRRRWPALFCSVSGLRAERQSRVRAATRSLPGGGMAGVTGVPLAVGLRLLLDGQAPAAGVHAPETAFDPATFFDALAPLCEPAGDKMADIIETDED